LTELPVRVSSNEAGDNQQGCRAAQHEWQILNRTTGVRAPVNAVSAASATSSPAATRRTRTPDSDGSSRSSSPITATNGSSLDGRGG
jgi:hypothetical protein